MQLKMLRGEETLGQGTLGERDFRVVRDLREGKPEERIEGWKREGRRGLRG